MADEVPSFKDFVQANRDKKKKEKLAEEIFGKGRTANRKAAPARGAGATQNSRKPRGPIPFAARNGITKRSVSAKPNINGRWGHDLHGLNNPRPRSAQGQRPNPPAQVDRNNHVFSGLRSNIQDSAPSVGFNIKGAGSSGPTTVVASNFAPGTTAADIESVMAPVGGELLRCRLISSKPTVMVEMVFADTAGAENVVATFNNKKADGRLLYVYIKQSTGGAVKPQERPIPKGPRAHYETDAMEVDDGGQDTGSYNARKTDADAQGGGYGFGDKPSNKWNSQPQRLFYENTVTRERF